jgi:endonuclease YncB( thermonuclease family)
MRFVFAALACLMFAVPALAQQPAAQPPAPAAQPAGEATPAGLPERIIRPMRATDPMTLKAEGVNIRLWGIKPAQTSETPLELKALDLMDALIQEQQVNCKIVGGAFPELTARCTTQGNQDLALALLEGGYVVVDRQQTYNSVFATGYEKAQETARLRGKGIWRYLAESDDGGQAGGPKWMKPYMDWLMPVGLVFGPLLGLCVMALVLRAGLSRIASRQEDEAGAVAHKEAALQLREKRVLVSTLEGELEENKNKIDAYIVIYGDLLSHLKEPGGTPKYQQAGDIVQKHPAFSKTVFESNVAKLSLLDMKAAGLVSRLYASLPRDPEYINLEPDVPLETAVKLVEKIVADAENLRAPIEAALEALRAAAAE